MPEIQTLEQRNRTRQEPDRKPSTTTIVSSAMRGLVHSSLTKSSRHALRRRASGRGTSGRGTLGRLSPPADWPSGCWFTSTSKVFPDTSASRRVCTAGRGYWDVTSPTCSSPLRGRVSGVRGHGKGSVVQGHGADSRGCGRCDCLRICCPCSGSTIDWWSTMVSQSSADVFTLSPWPIVWGSLPSSSSISSSSSSSTSSSSSSFFHLPPLHRHLPFPYPHRRPTR